MFLLDFRPSDSPFVKGIWHARSACAGSFVSTAATHWELVVTTQDGTRPTVTVRGPETRATPLS